MKYLFIKSGKLKSQLKKRLFFFLDYDGTLTPIAKTPEEAVLPQETKQLLKNLLKTKKCELAIISGRTLQELKKNVGLRNIIYAGSHGFEIEGPNFKFKYPLPYKYKTILKQIRNELHKKLSSVKGIIIEDKRYSVCLHYRLVNSAFVHQVRSCFRRLLKPHLRQKQIVIYRGKSVLEARPNLDWNKGKTVLRLLEKISSTHKATSIFPVYIGDDITDEDAFKILKAKGLTIFVGKPGRSHAGFYLYNIGEVVIFLKHILEIISNKQYLYMRNRLQCFSKIFH